ncbi:MAG: hypothetical protein COB49_04505 [Alphaproteobacteria bacterium]|nr:MAG: hypothetical protein COB49_04505 [Alphaproteobacteria bacterium]
MLNRIIVATLKAVRTLYHRHEGMAAVEYAMVLPLFVIMTVGGFELGKVYMVNSSLEGAISNATRTAMTGNVPNSYTNRSDYIADIVLSNLEDAGVTSGVTISMQVYGSFADIGEPEPYVDANNNSQYDPGECFSDINDNTVWDDDMGSSGAGGEENIVLMSVDINLPYMTGIMAHMMGGQDSINLSASTVIRNEPFGGVAWEPSSNVICT